MTNTLLDRTGAACGVAFPLVLFFAAGDGSHAYDPARAAAGVWAIALAAPFVAYVSSLIRRQEGPEGWLAPAALAAGTSGIVLKLVSEVSALAGHRAGVGSTGQMHDVLEAMGGGATVICLASLAIFSATVAVSTLHLRAFPRWIGIGAALTAIALAANSVVLGADFVPAFLLFMLWSLLTGAHRLVAAGRRPALGASPAASTSLN